MVSDLLAVTSNDEPISNALRLFNGKKHLLRFNFSFLCFLSGFSAFFSPCRMLKATRSKLGYAVVPRLFLGFASSHGWPRTEEKKISILIGLWFYSHRFRMAWHERAVHGAWLRVFWRNENKKSPMQQDRKMLQAWKDIGAEKQFTFDGTGREGLVHSGRFFFIFFLLCSLSCLVFLFF